ncbi:MAG: DUF4872 domain-containing protein [Chloroflexi bacterium]|nr:DUF4872 domain-containing protein [Chloroflexota bacterium]
MPTLPNFTQFEGRYWDTAAIRNALDYQGVLAPHTGQPFSEAMLLGISGGVTFGYFTFHYKGYDPQVNLLTRNTFEPMERIYDRMKLPRDLRRSASANKGRQNLIDALEEGYAAIASPDGSLLPYNALPYDQANWHTMPLVIYGYEPDSGEAYISDRSRTSLTVSTDDLDAARARVKKDRHGLTLLGAPDDSALAGAIRAGIADTVQLMTEKPLKGSARNFGLKALQHWADMLAKTSKGSWAREYATGRPLLAVLISSYTFLGPAFGKTMGAERDVYADFLNEAAAALEAAALNDVAALYRESAAAWQRLLDSLLPEDAPMLSETRALIDRKTDLFIESGAAQLDEIRACYQRLEALKTEAESDFPLSESEVAELRASIRDRVLEVSEAEAAAVLALKGAIS